VGQTSGRTGALLRAASACLSSRTARRADSEIAGLEARVQAIRTPPTMARAATTRRNRRLGLARTEVSTMGSHSHCNFPEGNRDCPVRLALRSWCGATSVRLLGAAAHQQQGA
jgi:hypothetical protein